MIILLALQKNIQKRDEKVLKENIKKVAEEWVRIKGTEKRMISGDFLGVSNSL